MKKVLMLVLVAMVAFSVAAYAETVTGKVASVDSAANKLSITKADAVTVEVSVTPETKLEGIATLAEVVAGEEVTVEGTADATTGVVTATSVVKAAVVPVEAPVEAPAAM